MSGTHEPGAAIRAALEAHGCALEAHEGRALAESLIALICSGTLVAEDLETAHTYNMGSLNTSERGDRG